MAELEAQVERHDQLYHVLGQPEITDQEYDALRQRLERLEEQHPRLASPLSPTRRVGGAPARWLSHRKLAAPMLSLRKVRTEQEWLDYASWVADRLDQDPKDLAWVLEPKLDGVALELVYEHGRLASACTRGDGCMGEDVTRNVRGVVPAELDFSDLEHGLVVVHGEAVIRKADFAALNAHRAMDKLPEFDSPRTAVAGALRSSCASTARDRGVGFLAWNWPSMAPHESHLSNMADLRGFGLSRVVARHSVGDGRAVLADILRSKSAWSENILSPTDGVVSKLDSLAHRRALGTTAVAPRWAVALKF